MALRDRLYARVPSSPNSNEKGRCGKSMDQLGNIEYKLETSLNAKFRCPGGGGRDGVVDAIKRNLADGNLADGS